MGFNPQGTTGPSAAASTTPYGDGRHYDAAGNLVDKDGNIIATPAQLSASNAQMAAYSAQEAAKSGGVFGNQTAGDLLTKDNPVAGTLRAGDDLIHGDVTKAASDFGQGTSYGTLPQLGPDGQIQPGDTISNVVPGVNPDSIQRAGDAIGGAAGAAGSAIGGAAGAIGGALGDITSGPSGGPTADASQLNDFRQKQLDYTKQLQDVINGTAGPSAAEVQGRNLSDRAMAQQFAAAQGATGQNSGLAYRQALQNAAGMQQQQIADATANRAKETAQARDQYGNLLSTGRSGDLSKYSTDVGAGNVRYAADKDFQGKKIAAAAGVVSGGLGALISDETKKTNISDGDDDVRQMLDALKAHDFNYKDPNEAGAAPGKRTGIMAQDLEKSAAGSALVKNTPSGKEIDSPQAIGAMLAALAELNGRVKRVEARR